VSVIAILRQHQFDLVRTVFLSDQPLLYSMKKIFGIHARLFHELRTSPVLKHQLKRTVVLKPNTGVGRMKGAESDGKARMSTNLRVLNNRVKRGPHPP
jgi:hypothetical protein